jgi:hypothetical protein
MITDNLKKINDAVIKKCDEVGRNYDEIKIIAVSKNHPVDSIKEALSAGVFNFGENKAQDLRDKAELLKGEFYWHFIGHLQSNKVKYVVKAAEYIHSVDSLRIAEDINKKAAELNKIQKVLFEIKTSDEATKYGIINDEQCFKLAEECARLNNIEVVGLMTMAPYTDDNSLIRESFKKLFSLKEELNNADYNLSELSMGMTSDFEIAIEEGSTMLRIGTAIFGERIY